MRLLDAIRGGSDRSCDHVPADLATPSGAACEECGSTRSLRMCATCGHVGCCDTQAGDARDHYRQSGHEVMVQMPVEHGFRWCYAHDRYLD
jgi:uncharacterized UBP type Zn finger protein